MRWIVQYYIKIVHVYLHEVRETARLRVSDAGVQHLQCKGLAEHFVPWSVVAAAGFYLF